MASVTVLASLAWACILLSTSGVDAFSKDAPCRMTYYEYTHNVAFCPTLNIEIGHRTTLPSAPFSTTNTQVDAQKIALTSSSLDTLPDRLMEGLTLEHLDLSHNQITAIPENGLQVNTPLALDTLDLSNNQIATIASRAFYQLSFYNLLLGNNMIQSLPEDLFGNSWDLPTLSLNNTQFRSTLKTLDLSHNSLSSLPPTIFSEVYIGTLDLSHNSFSYLLDTVFSQGDIGSLDLTHNMIDTIASRAFFQLSLNKMLLSNNRIQSLPADVFGNDLDLLTLQFNNTNFKSVFQTLDLSHNILTTLPATIFSQVYIGTLNLNFNIINALPDQIFSQAYIRTLRLENNYLMALPRPLGLDALQNRDPRFQLFAEHNPYVLNKQICKWGYRHPAWMPTSLRSIFDKVSTTCTKERTKPNSCTFSDGPSSVQCRNVQGCPFGVCTSPPLTRCVSHNNTGYSCQCPAGFTGPNCDIDMCMENPCPYPAIGCSYPNGIRTCQCQKGYSGNNCDIRIPLESCSRPNHQTYHLIYPPEYYANSSATINEAFFACFNQGMHVPQQNEFGCVQRLTRNTDLGPDFAKPPFAGVLVMMPSKLTAWRMVDRDGNTRDVEWLLGLKKKLHLRVVCVTKP